MSADAAEQESSEELMCHFLKEFDAKCDGQTDGLTHKQMDRKKLEK